VIEKPSVQWWHEDMSPSANWYSVPDENGQPEYHWTDGPADAVVWKEDGNHWRMHFTPDSQSEGIHIDLGKTRSSNKALNRADHTIGVAQDIDDVQNVVNMASEIDDRTPAEQASIDRINRHLERPSFDRDLSRDQGNGYDLGQ
jgi:hypothetical protein